MSVKTQVLELVNKFKKENYLKDKTDAMGDGLLLGANLADEANERSKDAVDTTLAVQEKYKEQILVHDLDPNKDPELVDLRNGKQTAGERITEFENETTESIEKINLKTIVNLLDYEHLKIAVADGYDWQHALQRAVDEAYTVMIPEGTFLIGNTIRERTNGGARQIIGFNQFNSILKAVASMTYKPILWLGNSTGHGNYRGLVNNLTIDGGDYTRGNIGIRWHEAGTSSTRDVRIMLCDKAVEALGSIHHIFEGNTIIQGCGDGVLLKKIPTGTPASLDDISVTASPLTLNTNVSKVNHIWFTDIKRTCLLVEGGLVSIDGCTFQGTTKGGALYDAVSIKNANESKDYGGGPIMKNCWFEGGAYRYAVAIRNTRAFTAEDNFISGSASYNGEKEGAFLLANSPSAKIKHNSIRGFFDRTPSEGRLANGAVYADKESLVSGADIDDNYITKVSINYYFEGIPNPSIAKPRKPHWAVIMITDGVANIVDASDDFIGSVTQEGTGMWIITYKANKESAVAQSPLTVTPITSGPQKAYTSNVYNQNAANHRVAFRNEANAYENPLGFTIQMFGEFRTY